MFASELRWAGAASCELRAGREQHGQEGIEHSWRSSRSLLACLCVRPDELGTGGRWALCRGGSDDKVMTYHLPQEFPNLQNLQNIALAAWQVLGEDQQKQSSVRHRPFLDVVAAAFPPFR